MTAVTRLRVGAGNALLASCVDGAVLLGAPGGIRTGRARSPPPACSRSELRNRWLISLSRGLLCGGCGRSLGLCGWSDMAGAGARGVSDTAGD